MVMCLVLALDVVQDLNSLINSGRLNHDLLETPVKCTVFFNILAVLIKRCCTDTLQLPSSKSRFENIACVKRARSPTRADNGMQLIDKKNHVTRTLQFIHQGLHPLLELASVFCTRHKGSKIQSNNSFIIKNPRYLALDNFQGKTLGNSRLADTRLPYQHRIVLFPSAQNLRNTLDFFFTAYDRIKLVFDRQPCDIPAEIVQDRSFRAISPFRFGFFRILFRPR